MGLYVPWQSQEREINSVIKPFHWAEQRMEGLLGWLKELAFLEILGIVSNIGLLIAVATYIGSEKQRRDAEVLNAWQTITSAYGQAGSGGRIQALEFLNASPGANWRRKSPWFCAPHSLCSWQAENLSGINLSIPGSDGVGVYLVSIQLPKANLTDSNLKGANVSHANLKGANLEFANLEESYLWESNLEGADLTKANLRKTGLTGANLKDAFLEFSNLEKSLLSSVDLTRANLVLANLKEAQLAGSNLTNASLASADLQKTSLIFVNLSGANLSGAILADANLSGAEGLTQDQLDLARICRTTLPVDMSLDPNRDCESLGIDLEAGYLIGQ